MDKQDIKIHKCPDGVLYTWKGRKANPKACPRCKTRLDFLVGKNPDEGLKGGEKNEI